jgi:hypothetical protein
MAFRRNVLQEDDILCELYADTHSDVSEYSDNESLDRDSDVTKSSSREQFAFCWFTNPTNSTPIFCHICQDNFYKLTHC